VVVRRAQFGTNSGPLKEETSKLDRSICSKALWRGVLRGLLFYGARDWPRRAPQMMVFRLLSGLTQLFRKKTSLSLFLSPLAEWWFRCQRVRRNDQKQEKEITRRLRDESFPQLLFGPVSWFFVRRLLIGQLVGELAYCDRRAGKRRRIGRLGRIRHGSWFRQWRAGKRRWIGRQR
jgi:hypothetical protein